MVTESFWEHTRRIIKKRESWKNYWLFFVIGLPLVAYSIKLSFDYPQMGKIAAILCISMWVFHFIIRYWWVHSHFYAVDEDVLKIRSGFIFRVHEEIPISEIVNIKVVQSTRDKILGVGTLAIITKTENPACFLKGISDPQDVKDHIYKVRDMILLPNPEKRKN